MYVGESEEGVVDDGGAVDQRGADAKGAYAGEGGVDGVRKTAVEDEEGGRGGEVEKVSASAVRSVGREGGGLVEGVGVTGAWGWVGAGREGFCFYANVGVEVPEEKEGEGSWESGVGREEREEGVVECLHVVRGAGWGGVDW